MLFKKRIRKVLFVFTILNICLCFACTSVRNEQRLKDNIGINYEVIELKQPLDKGLAEAYFKLNLSGDQMMQKARKAELLLVVRYEDKEYRQVIAKCKHPSLGNVLGGGTVRELEVALCNGEYWLISEPGSVIVLRMDKKSNGIKVACFELPDTVRAVTSKAE